MIDIHVQGSAWSEITQELRRMLGDGPLVVTAEKQTDYEELEALRRQLDDAEERFAKLDDYCSGLSREKTNLEVKLVDAGDKIAVLEETNSKLTDDITVLSNLVVEKDGIIADLKKQLADAEAANPTPTGATTADTETNAPGTGTAPAKTDEIEQTEIPAVTEAPVKEFKKEEVRAVLMKCRAANITISDILAPYGGSLGAVKKEDYAKVIEAAEAALAEVKAKEDK